MKHIHEHTHRGQLTSLGELLCLAGAAFGAVGLLGWMTRATILTTLVPGQQPMMPNAGLALLLVGITGALQRATGGSSVRRVLSRLAAAIVLAIGIGTVVEYALEIDLRIDQLVAHAEGAQYPGRPSPLAGLALAFLAGSLFLFDFRPTARVRPSDWLILSAGLLAAVAFVGQSFGEAPVFPRRTPPIALPTALSLMLTSFGLLLQRPDAGLMRVATSPGPGGVLVRRVVPATIVGPVVLVHLVIRLFAAFGTEDLALIAATFAAAMSVAGVLLLTTTAARLDRSHEALDSARERTRDLIEQAPDGIFIANPNGEHVDVNTAGCRMLGYRREEIIGKKLVDFIVPHEAERFGEYDERLLRGGIQVSEWTLRCKDGRCVPVEVSAKILPDGRWQSFFRDISERKRAQDEIRQSQERFGLALRGANLGAWDWNILTGEIVFNARCAEIRGLDPNEIRAHVAIFTAGVNPDDLARVQKTLADHFDGRISEYESEHRIRSASGDWTWVLHRGKVCARDENGKPTRMVGTELDITERKRLEEELRLSEARASGIVSISADAIISIDEDHRITLFNEGAAKIFGYSKSEVLGVPLDILIPERMRPLHHRAVESFAAGKAVARRMRGPILALRKTGEEFLVDGAISKLDVGGKRILTVALRDVSQQRRSEKEQKFLAQVGSTLVTTLDYDETITSIANLAVRDLADVCLVEVVEEELVRRLKSGLRDPSKAAAFETLERMQLDVRRPHLGSMVLETREPFLMRKVTPEYLETIAQSDEHLQALREIGPASFISLPLIAHGRLLGAMILIRTSATRRYEAQDLFIATELAHRAALAIDNARLYRTARRAVEARDELLGIVAHDLRNPLHTILMQASLLGRRGTESELHSRKSADAIRRSVTRMNRLIQDLLDVTKMEVGHLTIQQARVATERVISDSVEAEAPLASSSAIELRLELTQNLPEVWADRDRLLQVLENLIGNSLKFTKPNGRITVGAGPRDGEVLFWVADTGIGVAAENVPRLFDRFWQAQREGHLGAGLGLPIVKGIVKAHGGRIWVESTPGRGSIFYFTIPTAAGVAEPRSEIAPYGRDERVGAITGTYR